MRGGGQQGSTLLSSSFVLQTFLGSVNKLKWKKEGKLFLKILEMFISTHHCSHKYDKIILSDLIINSAFIAHSTHLINLHGEFYYILRTTIGTFSNIFRMYLPCFF